jgi:transcription elongation factor GreA
MDRAMEKVPMTQRGYTQLDEELKRLKSVERPAVVRALEEARAHGDLSENAEYHAAKERQAWIETRVMDLETKISRAQVIVAAELSGNRIVFGATVTIFDDEADEERSFEIVGEDEADIKQQRISVNAPLARALIGKEAGDEVEVNAPGGGKYYEVVKVKFQ